MSRALGLVVEEKPVTCWWSVRVCICMYVLRVSLGQEHLNKFQNWTLGQKETLRGVGFSACWNVLTKAVTGSDTRV